MIFALAYFFHITLPESLYEGVEIAMFEIRSKPFKRSAHLNKRIISALRTIKMVFIRQVFHYILWVF